MAEVSHALRRAATQAVTDFPVAPTLLRDLPCDGMALIVDKGAPWPEFRLMRDHLAGLWRGPLETTVGSSEVIVATFVEPVAPHTACPAAALPLRVTGPGELASFSNDHGVSPARRQRLGTDGARGVALWWAGQKHRVALAALEPVSLAALWDAPRLVIHQPSPPPATSLTAPPPTRSGRARVSHAKVAIEGGGPNLVDGVADQLRQLDERTRLSSIFRQVFRRGARKGSADPAGSHVKREPGPLENLAGWVRWHTPLGASLRRGMAGRQKLFDKLVGSGDLDSALKLAVALGGAAAAAGARRIYPSGLFGGRDSLEFRVDLSRAVVPILGADAFQALRSRYLELAGRLERQGDHRRAAYIHSQLLQDHNRAVRILEAGGMLREAARLALDARLPPGLAIRLLFKAGEKEAALTLARRSGCFDQLAEESRGKDAAYHVFVITAWTDMLVATGQPLRALQVTDELASGAGLGPALARTRKGWLEAAAALAGGAGPDPEVIARILLTGPWTGGALSPADVSAFPFIPGPPGPGAFPRVLAMVQRAARGEAEDTREALTGLVNTLLRLGDPQCEEQAGFWVVAAQPVVEALARAMFELVSEALGSGEVAALQRLLQKVDLPVLATDLGKLRQLHSPPPPMTLTWRPPQVGSVRPVVRCACLLANGDMVVWRASGILQLLDRQGRQLWSQPLDDVTALVAVAAGANVLVIQAQVEGPPLLSRLAAHERRLHPIGAVAIVAHHDVTSEGQWLVQIGGEIGALDLVKLCAPSPEVEFLWSCALTERVRAVAFGHHPQAAGWITSDVSPFRAGVLEVWSRHQSGAMTNAVCLSDPRARPTGDAPKTRWFWIPQTALAQIEATDGSGVKLRVAPWNERSERDALDYAAERREQGVLGRDWFQSCDFARPYVRYPVQATQSAVPAAVTTSIIAPGPKPPRLDIEHEAAQRLVCLARSPCGPRGPRASATSAGLTLLGDNAGRLFLVDLDTKNVAVI